MRKIFFVFVFAALAAFGCEAGRSMSPAEFSTRCAMYNPSNRLAVDYAAQKAICREYSQALANDFANMEECAAACSQVKERLYPAYVYRGGGPIVSYGHDNCYRCCLGRYGR